MYFWYCVSNSALCVLNYFFLFIPTCSFLSVFGSVQCFSKGGCWEDLPLELNFYVLEEVAEHGAIQMLFCGSCLGKMKGKKAFLAYLNSK